MKRKLGNNTLQRNRLRFSFTLNSKAIQYSLLKRYNEPLGGPLVSLKKITLRLEGHLMCVYDKLCHLFSLFDRCLPSCVMLLFNEKRRKKYNCSAGKVLIFLLLSQNIFVMRA